NGWIICWGATDWFGALGAFTWLPWAWWGAERALDRERTKWRFLWPAPFVYLLVTGGFPYTVLMLLVLIAWLAIKSLGQMRNIPSILPMLFGVALGFGLSAPAWLAILDLVQGSARELPPAAGLFRWSFRWLPLFQLVLAICAAEALQMRPRPATAAATALALVILTAIAMSILGTGGGSYTFPLTWIFLGVAALWYVSELFLR